MKATKIACSIRQGLNSGRSRLLSELSFKSGVFKEKKQILKFVVQVNGCTHSGEVHVDCTPCALSLERCRSMYSLSTHFGEVQVESTP